MLIMSIKSQSFVKGKVRSHNLLIFYDSLFFVMKFSLILVFSCQKALSTMTINIEQAIIF